MLNSKDSALVIIDIQDRLVLASKYGTEVAQNMAKVSKAAQLLEIPTIVTEQYPQGLGATVPVIKETLNKNAFITEKTAFSAMLEPAFAQKIKELKELGRKQIVIGGIETHICVLQTAADLINEGFEVYIIKDACASRNKSEYKTGLELLKQYGAKITCVEIALFEWLKNAKHPQFKNIQALIK
ncbi:MAG: hydrolase [Muribaculaceae bacterium]|nr:hydrolase [Muribaculaceae bacterium]